MMKFKVVGTSLKTAARMVIEVEAHNRAAAERTATQAGIEVLHVEHISDDPLDGALARAEPRASQHGETLDEPGSHRARWIGVAIVVVLVLVALVVLWGLRGD